MKDKHFEVVTAGSLAKAIVEYVLIKTERVSDNIIEQGVERLLEPHIRKPSDVDKPMFNLEADVEWLVRGCMRIMHNKKDGDIKAYRELRDFVLQKIRPTGPETNSVPERCEEAYNEAAELIEYAHETITRGLDEDEWSRKYYSFIQKPNPFKEADIVDKEEDKQPEQVLLPFSLKEAKNGAKVVTRTLLPIKIVADDLDMQSPILGIIDDGKSKTSFNWMPSGRMYIKDESDYDLFILKEPETVEVSIYKNKYADLYRAAAYDEVPDSKFKDTDYELIKTITVTI